MQRKFQMMSVLDGNYCFIGYGFSVVLILAVVLLVLSCACWVFLLTLVFIWLLGTRWSSLHGMGVATSWWAYIHSFIKQTSRLNNSFGIENCHVVVWLLLKIYLFGCVGWWERLFTIFIFTLLYLYFSATDFRIYKAASIKIY